MSPINRAAVSAREAARDGQGRFGEQGHGDPGQLGLDGGYAAAMAADTPASPEPVEALDSQDWVPEGWVAVRPRTFDVTDRRVWLVERSAYRPTGQVWQRPVIDTAAAVDVTELAAERFPERPIAPLTSDLGTDYTGLTGRQADRARAELEKRHRLPDGTTETLAAGLARRGVRGKSRWFDDAAGALGYCVQVGEDGRARSVSKATYDALTGIPEAMTEHDHALVERGLAGTAHDRALDSGDETRIRRAETRLAKAEARYRAASEAQERAYSAWQADRRRRVAEAIEAARRAE